MEIISQRTPVDVPQFRRTFSYRTDPGGGFSFDCDAQGNLLPLTNSAAQENLAKCLNGTYDVIDEGVRDCSYTYWEPKVGRCCCGREVVLDSFTNACDCGRDYNTAGDLLAPREQWGEETGESLSDILRIP